MYSYNDGLRFAMHVHVLFFKPANVLAFVLIEKSAIFSNVLVVSGVYGVER